MRRLSPVLQKIYQKIQIPHSCIMVDALWNKLVFYYYGQSCLLPLTSTLLVRKRYSLHHPQQCFNSSSTTKPGVRLLETAHSCIKILIGNLFVTCFSHNDCYIPVHLYKEEIVLFHIVECPNAKCFSILYCIINKKAPEYWIHSSASKLLQQKQWHVNYYRIFHKGGKQCNKNIADGFCFLRDSIILG